MWDRFPFLSTLSSSQSPSSELFFLSTFPTSPSPVSDSAFKYLDTLYYLSILLLSSAILYVKTWARRFIVSADH